MSNYRLEFIEDSCGNLVDVLYFHRFCAPGLPDYPCPEWPDYSVYCEKCRELIHEGTED